jgi:RNA polymerase sigma-70 factor (ECF subfamily)
MDYHRRNTVRNKYMAWLGRKDEENMVDPLETVADEKAVNPESEVDQVTCMQVLERAVRDLPPRQQQAFMLRALEGLDVAQTASVMKCSQGSVKTHYFRAISVLRERLGDYKI